MSVSLERGVNGLPCLALSHPSGSTARLYLYGAHLTSWVPAGGVEALFLSRASEFAAGEGIRGGVPVVFPQFAQRGPLPKHGFARTSPWRWTDEAEPDQKATEATLELLDSDTSRGAWPHAFRARLTVELGERTLSQRLAIENTGATPFSFTAALHSYFAVAELSRISLEGLAGTRYEEWAARVQPETAPGAELRISDEFNRVYLDAPPGLRLNDPGNGRALDLRLDGFEDVVVWNPGESGAAALPDMAPDEYRRMLCIEAAQVGRPVELRPGASWTGAQLLEAVPSA